MEEADIEKIQNYKLVDQKYYIKNKVLGKGNFATTYLATLKDDQSQIYACKMIAKDSIIEKLKSASNPEQRKEYIIQSLKNEVKLWKQLDHDNIVRFIEFSETHNNIYFFLEYCDSGDLEKELKNKSKLPEKDALEYFNQISAGCAYLYNKGIYHRDLKPENILLHNKKAKIADFGFSKVIEQEKKDQSVNQTSVGTPFYMAPQILSGEQYSIKCDVWSLGIMFYQILYGYLPWIENTNIQELLKKIKNQKLSFAPSVKVSDELKDIISNMLQIDEANRISMTEVNDRIAKLYEKTQQE
ncbi:Protein kinase-like domain [Pseudocohnilembus persalinus]|uniref:Protein kinase-like domain n=1 Tax=Pseudocohnilembus persalinus TaxID=266149 RepID=A0A0V0R0N9_PSEPJ|nr:Protein kinase-like domain [Pseudocohnilembus persalinus]|eukprot:KRX08092.1 Protein kinase-like domain [Pseudocohnilembus persalinus]